MGVWIFSGITHLDFWAESPQTMPHSDNNNFLYYEDDFIYFYLLSFS